MTKCDGVAEHENAKRRRPLGELIVAGVAEPEGIDVNGHAGACGGAEGDRFPVERERRFDGRAYEKPLRGQARRRGGGAPPGATEAEKQHRIQPSVLLGSVPTRRRLEIILRKSVPAFRDSVAEYIDVENFLKGHPL